MHCSHSSAATTTTCFSCFLLCQPDFVVPARLRTRRARHPGFGRPVRRHRHVGRNGCETVAPAAARDLPAGADLPLLPGKNMATSLRAPDVRLASNLAQ